jgi:predicted MPP superfamily phosphohydrolase
MRILHIGDYHYKPKGNNYEQNLMVTKMIDNLKSKPKIDLVLFSGDLVNSGSDYQNFELAHESLIKKISIELQIPFSNIIISPGNHDIRREDCMKSIINYFDEKITNNDQINQEYDKNSNDYKLSIKSSQNYIKYLKTHFQNEYIEINDLVSLNLKDIAGKKIAIVALNSAWLSCGHREDKNFLMFPSLVLKNLILKIKDTDCKILMIHHPLSYFKEFNAIELEDLIHKEFDFIFSGHIHREQISTKYAGNNGIYANTTQATLTFDKDGQIGYSVINYSLEDSSEIVINRASYNLKDHLFIDSPPVHLHVPCGEEKAQQNKIRSKITSKFSVELNKANELLLEYDEESGRNFLDFFTNPVLSLNSGTDNTKSDKPGLFNFETLYTDEKSYLIFGKDKSGKTSLLKKMQLYFLKNYSQFGKVPFYLDYKDLEMKSNPIDLNKLIRNYYEIPKADSEKLIENGQVILLIDNLNTTSPVNWIVVSFLDQHRDIQFVICSDYIASRIYFEELDHLEYTKLYFKDLTRKEIRQYSKKHNSVKEYKEEEVLEKVTKMLKQLQLPVNYWTVSLILLIYKKSNNDYNKNLFGILDLCVDEILQKKQLLLLKTKLSFDQYKEICSRIAHYLLTKFKDDVYSAPAVLIINYIDSLIKSNIRLVGDANDIFNYLFEVGLLKEKNGKYTFRLNGLFEYFLAYYIDHHPEFKEEILNDNSIYLVFKNELEIYSGLNRKDEKFLVAIFNKTKIVFDKIITNYKEYGSVDNVLMQKLGEVYEFTEHIKSASIKSALTHEAQDLAKDSVDPLNSMGNSEVHLKEFIDANNITPEVLEKYLIIFSRVFKNCDNIANTNLIFEIFEYLLESYISWGFYLIDHFANESNLIEINVNSNNENNEVIIGQKILGILTNFVPILSQILLYDGIGHPNMENIIGKLINKYEPVYKENQYKLFLLYFLLMDIDTKTNKKYIDDVFEKITLSPLKVSTYFKLNFYLLFKTYQNKDLENFFKIKVRDSQKRMDEKLIVSSEYNKTLSNKQKIKLSRNM